MSRVFYLDGKPLTIHRGNDLKELVALGREGTTIILDEVSKMISRSPISLSLTSL